MKLIGDIINELMDFSKPLSGPLLKTKVLATRIGNQALLAWVNGELNGYTEGAYLPEYRITSGSLFGSYQNGAAFYKNVAIPIVNIENDVYENMVRVTVIDSVNALEKIERKGNVTMRVNTAVKSLLEFETQAAGNHYYQILSIHNQISATFFDNIISMVRSKLLEFMLELEKNFGEETAIEYLKTQNTIISQIMNTTINNHGDSNVINTGNDAKITVSNQISKGNKEILSNTLRNHFVSEPDIDELLTFVDQDVPSLPEQYSVPVINWMKKMLGKALDGSWQIGIGAAGGVLADALAVHYGLK